MRSKKELFIRLCDVESQVDYLQNELVKLEKRVKKCEARKGKKNEA